jgi:hypothetical protein
MTIKIENDKEEHLLLSALEFFVDFRFNTNSEMSTRYSKMIQKIDQNDYAILCKKLNGKTDWGPTV